MCCDLKQHMSNSDKLVAFMRSRRASPVDAALEKAGATAARDASAKVRLRFREGWWCLRKAEATVHFATLRGILRWTGWAGSQGIEGLPIASPWSCKNENSSLQ